MQNAAAPRRKINAICRFMYLAEVCMQKRFAYHKWQAVQHVQQVVHVDIKQPFTAEPRRRYGFNSIQTTLKNHLIEILVWVLFWKCAADVLFFFSFLFFLKKLLLNLSDSGGEGGGLQRVGVASSSLSDCSIETQTRSKCAPLAALRSSGSSQLHFPAGAATNAFPGMEVTNPAYDSEHSVSLS